MTYSHGAVRRNNEHDKQARTNKGVQPRRSSDNRDLPRGGGSAALADDGDTGVDAESIVTTQGLILESPQSTEAAAADGELVQAWEVIQPITDAQATSTLEGNAQLASESDHSFVTGIGANGNPTSIIVIDSASAPSTYSFHIGGEGGADLVLNKDGSVTVLDEMGMPMNRVEAPWATDALGRDLPTSFSVNGSILTQSVDLSNAEFPVVADPTFACKPICNAYFNKAETRDIANGSSGAGVMITAACAAVGGPIGGIVCGSSMGSIISTANVAKGRGDCLAIYFAGVSWGPYVYTKGSYNCR